MATLEYFLVAESASVDQTTNRVSVFNVLEDIQTADFPAVIPQLVAVAAWNFTPDDMNAEFQALLRITDPTGAVSDHRANFTGQRSRHRFIVKMIGYAILAEGRLQFEISLNDAHSASHTISVGRLPAPAATSTPRSRPPERPPSFARPPRPYARPGCNSPPGISGALCPRA